MSYPNTLSSKSQLRRSIRQKLTALTPEQSRAWGIGMLAQLKTLPLWQDVGPVLCFASTSQEPDTRPILEALLQKGRPLCLPRQTSEPGGMEARLVTDLSGLVPGAHGIWEPSQSCPLVPPQNIELILAPCLAAGRDGSRLGHGAGCYDRYFAKSPAFRAVLCPSEFVFDQLPVESTDQPIRQIITQDEIFNVF